MRSRARKASEPTRAARPPAGPAPAALLILVALLGLTASAASGASAATDRTVQFRGQAVKVPASWPVFRLTANPGMCVRLDRRAVYLGVPSPNQRCPAQAIGRRRAIVVDPSAPQRRRAERAARAAPQARVGPSPALTGLGFDACTAPSSSTMSTWLRSSSYRAVGVYVGGLNRGCSQANLTAGWVSRQTGAGWSLIPTYVGLQAPTSSCTSCAKIDPRRAAAQGSAAANDAVAVASGVGIGPGSPIYFDMESYSRTQSATKATLTFLSAWTSRLHGLGYTSGVYSSSASGMVDLAAAIGGNYRLPDDIWFANWNGQRNTRDTYFPASAWSGHHRIHQYRGGHNETYGGVTINIDSNFVDGATTSSAAPGPEDPVGRLEIASSPRHGELRVRGWAFDPSAPRAALGVTVYVGGREGAPGARALEPEEVAAESRSDVGAKFPKAGPDHGFDTQLTSPRVGAQPVCVYATDVGAGSDRLLGCRKVGIGVPVAFSGLRVGANRLRATITCQWPRGTACPGQVILRAHPRVRIPHRRGRPGTRVVRLTLARRTFKLGGGRSHTIVIPLSPRARPMLRERRFGARFLVALAGGRRGRSLAVGVARR